MFLRLGSGILGRETRAALFAVRNRCKLDRGDLAGERFPEAIRLVDVQVVDAGSNFGEPSVPAARAV